MTLESAFADGQLAALRHHKLAWPAPTHPVVQDSALLRSRETPATSPQAQAALAPPTDPQQVAQIFSAHEQGKTRTEPRRKLSAQGPDMCTSCRRAKHYGACSSPRPIPSKTADFNMGLTGDDPSTGDNPSTSPHYHSATSDSALARSRDGRPADEQAATGFADLFRHLGISNAADEPGRMSGGLNKVARSPLEQLRGTPRWAILERMYGISQLLPKTGGWQLWGTDGHSTHEQRGTPINPYEERLTVKSPPVGWGDEAEQRTRRAFDQIDCATDSTSVGGGFGSPEPGPAALG